MFRLCLITLLLMPAGAWAGGRLSQAERLFEEMEYDKALTLADRVLRSSGNGPAELVQAFYIRGLCLAAQGDQKASMEAFRRLLAIDVEFRLPTSLSPQLTAGFYQAVAYAKAQKPIALEHRPSQVSQVARLDKLKVTLLADPLGMVKMVRVHLRAGIRKKRVLAPVQGLGEVALKLPRQFRKVKLRYYIEALNGHGSVLARLRSWNDPFKLSRDDGELVAGKTEVPDDPGAVEVAGGQKNDDSSRKTVARLDAAVEKEAQGVDPDSSQADRPQTWSDQSEDDGRAGAVWYETWWFWTAVGVVVVGAAAGTAVALTADDGPSGPVNYSIDLQ